MDNILKQKTDKIISDYKEDTKPIIKRLEKEITKLQKNAHALKSEIQNLKSSLKVEFIKQKYAYEIFKYCYIQFLNHIFKMVIANIPPFLFYRGSSN